MRKLFTLVLAIAVCMPILAQRVTDKLDRGLVAVAQSSGVFCSWRILAEEYYDVKYNIYRDGTKLNSEPLDVSNYTDASGSTTSTYTVKAVVNGVEQTACSSVSVWSNKDGNSNPYLPIKVADVYDRNNTCIWKNNNGTITSTANYTINDISVGDVDGDGKIDFIVKRKNQTDQDNLFPTSNTTAFCRIEVYASTKNYGLLWYIDCGPNTVYGADEQWDAVAFDWDQDGRCEVLYRAYANTIIHKADGSTVTIGSAKENIRAYVSHVANMTFTNCGNEYLVYINGATGQPYVTMEYPLKRLESSEFSTSINWDSPNSTAASNYLAAVKTAWGDNYGHRSSKYFMGAPYLDGRTPSIFLGRGIYTRHKMIAYDVNPSTHTLTQKWTWSNSTSGSAWYGQGYHNYTIADVDEDGRDEIVYGSMVIDDNGKGLSTTGLGHGDASHTGDLDPFRKGMETYACNEDQPGNNFRDATTCEVLYRHTASDDDGRSMAGNFSNDYPGCMAASASDGVISCTTHSLISELTNNWNVNTPYPMALNFRIYWDGDLLEETINGPGSSEGNLFVDKLGARIMTTEGTACCNGTKKNPSASGDIIGDWREELVMRSGDNTEFRIYTTTVPTSYRIQSLWFDHEYRQAMVWQTEGYNQPPHTSYFIGEMENITAAPPAVTNTGKTEIADGGTITTSTDSKDVLIVVEPSKVASNNRYVVKYSGGISPSTLTINTPVIVAGNNSNSNITSTTYSCLLNPADGSSTFTGAMRLVKQGNGILNLYKKTLSHTGQTDIWGGTLIFNGTFAKSKLWMNRHTTLNTENGTFKGGIEMNYNSTMNVTTSVNVSDLKLNYGSRIALTVASASDATQNSQLNITGTLTIDKKTWSYGPTYSTPVLQINSSAALAIGKYPIGTISTVSGDMSDIVIEGNFASGTNQKLVVSDGTLYLKVYDVNEDYIGNVDNTTAWWGAFSNSYKIKSGYKYNFKFTNYSSGTNNWNNWVLTTANGTGHSTNDRADYAEYFVLRADQYGWGNYYNTPTLTLVGGTLNWTTFKTDMKAGADVDMDVTFVNSVVSVNATITSTTGNVYTYTFSSKEISADEITAFFTVDNSHMTKPVMTYTPYYGIKMTYVDGSNADTSQGEATTATAGYNKISGGAVAFANSGWGVNYIPYLQLDLSKYKKDDVDVNNVTFSFKGSGSTDSKRATGWGIGYNSSTWSSALTYNTADKSITTIGAVQYGSTTSSTIYNTFTWDITDVFNADADGIITLLVYETAASGGYITEPSISVDCSFAEDPDAEIDAEPTYKVAGTTTTYDFTSATSGNLTTANAYGEVGQNGWSWDSYFTTEIGNEIAFARVANGTKNYGFKYANGGLCCINQPHTMTLVGLKAGTIVTVNTSANAVSSTYQGNFGGTWESSVNDAATTYTYTMTTDGDLNLMMATGSYVYTVSIAAPSSLVLEPTSEATYTQGVYGNVTVNRNFSAGYSSLCIPFNTTISEFTNGDSDAHAFYLSGAEKDADGKYTMTFTKTDDIVANKPYLIYLSKDLSAPSFTSKAVFEEDAKTITCGDWSMTGNYKPGKSMSGLYGIASNASIKKGGSSATINGLTAFLTGPADAQTKVSLWDMDEVDTPTSIQQTAQTCNISVIGIYSLDGRRQDILTPGINIIRMSDGTIRKVNVKH